TWPVRDVRAPVASLPLRPLPRRRAGAGRGPDAAADRRPVGRDAAGDPEHRATRDAEDPQGIGERRGRDGVPEGGAMKTRRQIEPRGDAPRQTLLTLAQVAQ